MQRRPKRAQGRVARQEHLLGEREAPVALQLVPPSLREVTRIERAAPFLDDNVIAVQEGADAWCYEPGVSGRVWCILSQRYADAIAPEGWFFLYEGIGNRKTNLDLMKHGLMEVQQSRFTLSDGNSASLARLI
jgi:hypothetical protein